VTEVALIDDFPPDIGGWVLNKLVQKLSMPFGLAAVSFVWGGWQEVAINN
jgi:hypothetical protein